MSKGKKIIEQTEESVENVSSEIVQEQAVDSGKEFAKKSEKTTAYQTEEQEEIKEDLKMEENVKEEKTVVVQKSGGKGLAFLALLVALGIGGAGYYFGMQKLTEVDTKIQALSAGGQAAEIEKIELPNFDTEKAQIAELTANYQKAVERINQLEQEQTTHIGQIAGLQSQLQKVSGLPQSDSVVWKLSDADFLLNNALRKLVLDNDIDTTKNLLTEADAVLEQVSNPQVANVRAAIKADLTQLANVNNVDQNGLMLRLTTLANHLDDLPMVANEAEEQPATTATGEVSDSIQDWQKNIEKSANSFLDHFIRIRERTKADEKAFVAPNQEIYLRENIRLRLQIAILAIPRQQNELYKQSLVAVSTWIRSYFDTRNENVKNFLKELDDLAEQSVYVDAPESLQSLILLEQLLHKVPQAVEKIEIKAEKELEPVQEAPKSDSEPAKATEVESQATEQQPATQQ